ncbi:hypothetical protein ACA910_005672 [Epithemia clementina (nom. ined.)]
MVSETAAQLKRDCASGYRGPDLKLYVRDVRDPSGKKRPFEVKSWGTVKDAKEAIKKYITRVPVQAQRLYFGSPLLSSGKELPNYRTLHDAGIYRSGETLLLDICSSDEVNSSYWGSSSSSLQRIHASNDLCISTSLLNSTPKPLSKTIEEARRAFAMGIKPDLVMDGSGGSYYIHDVKKNRIAVFKPADEEPYAENNPRGYLPQRKGEMEGLRQGIAPGEACIREVAAYLLDHEGFADVPMTTLAEARHPAFNNNGARLKVSEGGASIGAHSLGSSSDLTMLNPGVPKKVGSFQEFVRSECSMDDISPSKLSVEQVHKIAILDIRLLNADRNPANLLCRRLRDNSLELVPIDHGYCLRSMCDVSWMDWCWLDWPQLKEPLSARSRDYIRRLDTEADARILRERLSISEEAIDYIRASTALLKAGVEAGLTMYDIAILCCRNDNLAETPSLLEHLTALASELAKVAVENEEWHHATASRALEEQLTPRRSSNRKLSGGIKSRDRSSNRFHRCASSGEFLVASDEDTEQPPRSNLSKALEQQKSPVPPLAALSSGSDSSGDNNNDETKEDAKEEIEEWAHSIIEDSFQIVPPPSISRHPRSESSDEGSSCFGTSPRGFWHVRPGSLDDDSFASSFGDDSSSFGTSPPQSIHHFRSIPVPQTLDTNRRPTSVTFATDEKEPEDEACLSPPTTVSVDSSKQEGLQASPTMTSRLQRMESNTSIPRSKSYTSLSRRFSSSNLSSVPSTTSKMQQKSTTSAAANYLDKAEEHEFYRTYFLKFIDLVIAREMARHHQQQQQSLEQSTLVPSSSSLPATTRVAS